MHFSLGSLSIVLGLFSSFSTIQGNNVEYCDRVTFQTNSEADNWLTGVRGSGNVNVHTLNAIGSDSPSEGTYRWLVRSADNYGNGSLNCQDPKSGKCVRYGDRIILQNAADLSSRWLSGGRGSGNKWVITIDRNQEHENPSYEWTVLSERNNFQDRAQGTCVENLSVVWLRANYPPSFFLSGNRGTEGSTVQTSDPFLESTNSQAQLSYQWTMRKFDGTIFMKYGDGTTNTGLRCAPTGAVGGWADVANIGVPTTITETMGVTREFSSTFTRTDAWETSVTTMISAGFDFKGVGVETSVAVEASFSGSLERSVSEAVALTEEVSIQRTFEAGTVWQFQFEVTDICSGENNPWNTLTDNLVQTTNLKEPPCCLPGLFRDPTNPHGPCEEGTPCMCEANICSGTPIIAHSFRREELVKDKVNDVTGHLLEIRGAGSSKQ